MQMFIARTGSQASVAVVFAIALNDYLDGKLKQTILATNIFGHPFEITSLQIIALVVIAIFTTLNCLSVSMSGQIAAALADISAFVAATQRHQRKRTGQSNRPGELRTDTGYVH
jgi:hypothetical protein